MATTSLAVSCGATDGLIRVSTDVLPADASYPIPISIDSETMLVMAGKGGTSWSVERGQAGTARAAHSGGASISVPAGGGGGGSGVTVDNGVDAPAAVTTLVARTALIDGDTATIGQITISADAPDIGAAQFWLNLVDTTNMGINAGKQPSYQLYVRNPDNDRWILASAGISIMGAPESGDPRIVGFFDAANVAWLGMFVDPQGLAVNITAPAADGTNGQVYVTSTGVEVRWNGDPAHFGILLDETGLRITGIPTTDPGVARALYTDGVPSTGVPKALMVSGG